MQVHAHAHTHTQKNTAILRFNMPIIINAEISPYSQVIKCMKFMQWVATLIILHASIHLTDVTINCNMKNMYP